MKLVSINISELLNRLVKRQVFLIEEKHMKTILKIEENLEIKADQERITKAINNIINNAIKYSPEESELIIRLYDKNKRISKRLLIKEWF